MTDEPGGEGRSGTATDLVAESGSPSVAPHAAARPRRASGGPPAAFWAAIAFGLAAVVSGFIGFFSMFANFQAYDDEGYLLVSLSEYVHRGGRLYDEVYTQYGPFYYEAIGGLFAALGIPFTQDAGRTFTLTIWIVTSLLLGFVVYRRTASLALGLTTMLLAYFLLFTLVNEPMHPGGLLMLLVAGMLVAGELVVSGRERVSLFALAALGALVCAALLTKINVGGFAAIAVAYSCAVSFPPLCRSTVVRAGAACALALTPLVLMARDLDQPAFFEYALLGAMAGLAVALLTAPLPPRAWTIPARRWLAFLLGGFGGALVVVCGIALLLGTSAGGLVHGALIDPFQQPRVFAFALSLPAHSLDWGFAALAGAAVVALAQLRRVAPEPGPRLILISALVRLAGGVAFVLAVAGSSPYTLGLGLPLACLAALPRPGEVATSRSRFQRAFLPSLAVLQSLQAYPVAASQVSWAAVLLAPAAAVTLADGWADLRVWVELRQPAAASVLRYAGLVLGVALVARIAVPAWVFAAERAWPAYRDGTSMGLPGASWLRVPPDQAETYRWITNELRDKCSAFVSLPGLNSFYVWTGQRPPTGLNTTTWMFLLSAERQQKVVDAIGGIDRMCVLHNPGIVDYWRQSRSLPERPLYTYIEQSFTALEAQNGYALLVRKG